MGRLMAEVIRKDTMETGTTTRNILVVDGHADHVRTVEAVLGNQSQYRVWAIATGPLAIAYLRQQGDYTEAPRPELILLDLSLPDREGWQVLGEIKADEHLRRIPIIIFTLSDDPDDIFNSYVQQGNCYVIKSSEMDQLTAIVQRIKDFWLEIVTLPRE